MPWRSTPSPTRAARSRSARPAACTRGGSGRGRWRRRPRADQWTGARRPTSRRRACARREAGVVPVEDGDHLVGVVDEDVVAVQVVVHEDVRHVDASSAVDDRVETVDGGGQLDAPVRDPRVVEVLAQKTRCTTRPSWCEGGRRRSRRAPGATFRRARRRRPPRGGGRGHRGTRHRSTRSSDRRSCGRAGRREGPAGQDDRAARGWLGALGATPSRTIRRRRRNSRTRTRPRATRSNEHRGRSHARAPPPGPRSKSDATNASRLDLWSGALPACYRAWPPAGQLTRRVSPATTGLTSAFGLPPRQPAERDARHAPQARIGIALTGGGERRNDIGPVLCDLSKRVHGSRCDVRVGMVAKELQGVWGRTVRQQAGARSLARVTSQHMECPGADRRIVVVERRDEVGDVSVVHRFPWFQVSPRRRSDKDVLRRTYGGSGGRTSLKENQGFR